MAFLMIVEFMGILIFTKIQQNMLMMKQPFTLKNIMKSKQQKVADYIFKIDKVRKDENISEGYYDSTVNYVLQQFLYSTQESFQHSSFF